MSFHFARTLRRTLATSLIVACAACTTPAPPRMAATMTEPCDARAVRSDHAIDAGTEALEYTACAGTLAVSDADGTKRADIFYTAYLAGAADRSTRPLAFIWNGGPGSDSRLLHFQALGPQLVRDGEIVANPLTLLRASDLVFVDPAGTGFSRAASAEQAKALYGTMGDISATASFIRIYLATHRRQGAPLFLIGESFGTWRASAVAEALGDAGVPVAGVGLISGGIPLGQAGERAMRRALSLPGRAAAAAHWNKVPAERVASAEAWALQSWYPALADPAAVPEAERDALIREIARRHGIATEAVDRESFWVSPRAFREALLAPSGRALNVFDMRRTMAQQPDLSEAQIIRYYREILGYGTGEYAGIEVPSLEVGRGWQYDQNPITKESLARALAGEGPPSGPRPWARNALNKMPRLRIFAAAGQYDSLNSCPGNERTRAELPADIGRRIELHCYAAGHMMYDDPAVFPVFARDLIAFVEAASREAGQPADALR